MNRTLVFASFTICLSVGCGGSGDKPPPFANVSGTVTFNGKPLEKGTITFSTDGRPPSQMDVIDGQYAGQAMVGSNRVSISAKRKSGGGTAKSPVPSQAMAAAKAQMEGYANRPEAAGRQIVVDAGGVAEMIPPEWGVSSKQLRVVESGGANKFDFDIKAKE